MVRRRNILIACTVLTLAAAWSTGARAGETSSSTGGLVVTPGTASFLFTRATGTNCVHVNAKGNAATALNDPGAAPACTITAGLLSIGGRGGTATKPTGVPPPSFTNTATRGGTTATGTASFTYTPGRILDSATYATSA